jgi:hypothetical protein
MIVRLTNVRSRFAAVGRSSLRPWEPEPAAAAISCSVPTTSATVRLGVRSGGGLTRQRLCPTGRRLLASPP